MNETVLLGRGDRIIEIPRTEWEASLSPIAHQENTHLAFMTGEHHRVRNFVVAELPRSGKPLEPEYIASRLEIQVEKTVKILDDLEKHLAFLVRDEKGAVAWAFPVTVDPTPHALTFKSGEQLYAA